MDMDNVTGVFANKIGPLAGWQWFGLAATGVLGFAIFKRKTGATDSAGNDGVRDPVTGEYKSAQSTDTVDPITGKRTTSSYEASGPVNGWGGGVGLPMAYPMPYSGGDTYVNLPGDTRNLQPGAPYYPPKKGPDPAKGIVGGYWWTPLNAEDSAALGSRSGLNPDADAETKLSPDSWRVLNMAWNRDRIIAANPQINWAAGDYRSLVGTPIYIPTAAGYWQDDGSLPRGATREGPANYTPPQQVTGVSGNG